MVYVNSPCPLIPHSPHVPPSAESIYVKFETGKAGRPEVCRF